MEDDGQLSVISLMDHTEIRVSVTLWSINIHSASMRAKHFISSPESDKPVWSWGTTGDTDRETRPETRLCHKDPVIHRKLILWEISHDFIQQDVHSLFLLCFWSRTSSFLTKEEILIKWFDVCSVGSSSSDADRHWTEILTVFPNHWIYSSTAK